MAGNIYENLALPEAPADRPYVYIDMVATIDRDPFARINFYRVSGCHRCDRNNVRPAGCVNAAARGEFTGPECSLRKGAGTSSRIDDFSQRVDDE